MSGKLVAWTTCVALALYQADTMHEVRCSVQYCFKTGWSLYSQSESHTGLGPPHVTAKVPLHQSCSQGLCLNSCSNPSSPSQGRVGGLYTQQAGQSQGQLP